MRKKLKYYIWTSVSIILLYFVVSIILLNGKVSYITHIATFDNSKESQKAGFYDDKIQYTILNSKFKALPCSIWFDRYYYRRYYGVLLYLTFEDKDYCRFNISCNRELLIGFDEDSRLIYTGGSTVQRNFARRDGRLIWVRMYDYQNRTLYDSLVLQINKTR